jgi:hypothetical protein
MIDRKGSTPGPPGNRAQPKAGVRPVTMVQPGVYTPGPAYGRETGSLPRTFYAPRREPDLLW